MNQEATESYTSKVMTASWILRDIQNYLAGMASTPQTQIHWGNVGDANHVLESLRELAEFMRRDSNG